MCSPLFYLRKSGDDVQHHSDNHESQTHPLGGLGEHCIETLVLVLHKESIGSTGDGAGETGALAGSTATLFDCVKTAVSFGIPAEDAFRMASETPAKLLGVKKGRIAPGYDAEFIVTDEENKLLDTLIF